MPPSKILDSHIHLWPATSLTPLNHSWMTPGHILTKRHGITDYLAIAQPAPNGFIYVETDRYLPSAAPDISFTAGTDEDEEEEQVKKTLIKWAQEPLEEIRFLKRIVERTASEKEDGVKNDGGTPHDTDLLRGAVIWAPFHLSPRVFNLWLSIAEVTAGPQLWSKIVGFRYLLQGKGEGEVKRLVESNEWIENIIALSRGREGKGWTFDVGVDVNRDGVEGLEVVGGMIEEVRKREAGGGMGVKFVLNHLCKHPLSQPVQPRWTKALEALSQDQNVYMKLSGAFNEFDTTPRETADITKALAPFVDVVLRSFPQRVMFGSDWPVCNVGGPRGESGNWKYWVETVESVLENRGLDAEERERVWWKAGAEAYGVEI